MAKIPDDARGALPWKSIDLDETEEEVQAGPTKLWSIHIWNASGATRYVRIYDGTAATVTVGTTVAKLAIPVKTLDRAEIEFPKGVRLDAGLTLAATTGVADNDAGAPGANDVIVNLTYN